MPMGWLYGSDPDQAVAGDPCRQRLFVEALGAVWAAREDHVAGLRAGVPDIDPDLGTEHKAEAAQYCAWISDHPGSVRLALVPSRGRPEQGDRVARAQRAHDDVVAVFGVLDYLEPLLLEPAAHGQAQFGQRGVGVGQQPGAEPLIGPGPRDQPGTVGR